MERLTHQLRTLRQTGRPRVAILPLAAALAFASPAYANDEAILTQLEPSNDRASLVISKTGVAQAVLRRVELERGKSVVLLPDFDVKRVSVGDPNIANVLVLSPREIHVVAKTIGDTNVVVWDERSHLQAAIDLHVGTPHSQIEAELRRVLNNETIRVDAAGEALVLKGTVQSPVDMERAVRVAKAFYSKDEDAAETAERRVINMLDIGGNQQVMIEIILAEMARSLRRDLGTNWAGVEGGSDTLQVFSFLNALTAMDTAGLQAAGATAVTLSDNVNFAARIMKGSDQLDVFIQAVQEDGLAKILAEPTLTARSGEPAQFLVGGEIPIPVPQGLGTFTIEFKEFGIGLQFTPTVMSGDRIHLKVSTEVSQPDLNIGTQFAGTRVPAFQTRRASTAVELGDGESFAIAGLLHEEVQEIARSFPLLGDIPVLGALFRSTHFERSETELVVIVRPRLVKPMKGTPMLPTDNFVEPSAFEFFFLGALEGGAFGREAENADDKLARFLDTLKINTHDGNAPTEDFYASENSENTPATSAGDSNLSTDFDPWTNADPIAGAAGHRVPFVDAEDKL